jgi:hypothetical protein
MLGTSSAVYRIGVVLLTWIVLVPAAPASGQT